ISGRPLLRLQGAEIPNDDLGHRVTTSNLITAPTNRETAARAGVVEPLPAGALHAPGLLRGSARRSIRRSAVRSGRSRTTLADQKRPRAPAIVPPSHRTSTRSDRDPGHTRTASPHHRRRGSDAASVRATLATSARP